MSILDRLRQLARNLYWVWHPEIIEIFRDLDAQQWRRLEHNPVAFLAHVDESTLAQQAADLALEARVTRAFHQLEDYLEAGATVTQRRAGPLKRFPVAYFSAEFGLHESLPIYSGGLGVLAGDHLKSASDLGVPIIGVGLFYAKGYFYQQLDDSGWQQEHYTAAAVEELPLEQAEDANGEPVRVQVEMAEQAVTARVWSAKVGRNRLLLLDTDVPENSESLRGLTGRLYDADRDVRIRQELLLGVGGMRALDAVGVKPGVIHLNEGHSAFAVLEACRRMMTAEQRPFHEVRDRIAATTVFTTHTPVEAGHDRFKPDLFNHVLRPLRHALGLDRKQLLGLGRRNLDDEHEPFCMTTLGLKMAQARNAVSGLHGQVSRRMWQGLWPGQPIEHVPIGQITNGVHIASWVAKPMHQLYDRYLGESWERRIHEPQTWAQVDRLNPEEFCEQNQILKTHLIHYARRRVRQQNQRRGEVSHDADDMEWCLDPAVLTIGFARRFAAYKRPNLLLHDRERLESLVNHPDRPIQIVFAGKAHPSDETGKELIRQVFELTREPRFRGRVVFIENHDINVARHLAQGVDLWLNVPRRPMEACGTSGQKVVVNGGLNCSVLDGWWAEAYDGTNGFAIGEGLQHSDDAEQDRRDAESLYHVLEHEVTPLFYDCDSRGIARGWLRMQFNALRTLAWRFSAERMIHNYLHEAYLPAGGATGSWPSAVEPASYDPIERHARYT